MGRFSRARIKRKRKSATFPRSGVHRFSRLFDRRRNCLRFSSATVQGAFFFRPDCLLIRPVCSLCVDRFFPRPIAWRRVVRCVARGVSFSEEEAHRNCAPAFFAVSREFAIRRIAASTRRREGTTRRTERTLPRIGRSSSPYPTRHRRAPRTRRAKGPKRVRPRRSRVRENATRRARDFSRDRSERR